MSIKSFSSKIFPIFNRDGEQQSPSTSSMDKPVLTPDDEQNDTSSVHSWPSSGNALHKNRNISSKQNSNRYEDNKNSIQTEKKKKKKKSKCSIILFILLIILLIILFLLLIILLIVFGVGQCRFSFRFFYQFRLIINIFFSIFDFNFEIQN